MTNDFIHFLIFLSLLEDTRKIFSAHPVFELHLPHIAYISLYNELTPSVKIINFSTKVRARTSIGVNETPPAPSSKYNADH